MTNIKAKKRLEKARRIRVRMSDEFKRLKNGDITLYELLEDCSKSPLRRARVYDVLRRAPHLSDAGAKKILLTARVWPLTKLGDLEKIERNEILKCLPPRAR